MRHTCSWCVISRLSESSLWIVRSAEHVMAKPREAGLARALPMHLKLHDTASLACQHCLPHDEHG